jgi:hypothetical protein
MEVEVIPNQTNNSRPQTNPEPYQDLEPETPPEFREPEQKPNEFSAWLKQNKLTAGLIGVTTVILLGVAGFQIFASEPEPTIVEVRTFEDCVANGGVILPDTDPRECYIKQKQFVEVVEEKPQPEAPKPEEEEEEPEEEEVKEKTYANETFPDFGLTYPNDWEKTEDNTETGTTVLFQKDGLTLTYNIGLIEIFGDQGGRCTNNTFLFLDIEGSDWYRVRLNNGERYYTTNLLLKSEGNPANNSAGSDLGNTSKAKTEWVEVMPVPEGVYEACLVGSTNIAGVTDTTIPAEMDTTTGYKFGLVSVQISGINESNKQALAEADAIVASTQI